MFFLILSAAIHKGPEAVGDNINRFANSTCNRINSPAGINARTLSGSCSCTCSAPALRRCALALLILAAGIEAAFGHAALTSPFLTELRTDADRLACFVPLLLLDNDRKNLRFLTFRNGAVLGAVDRKRLQFLTRLVAGLAFVIRLRAGFALIDVRVIHLAGRALFVGGFIDRFAFGPLPHALKLARIRAHMDFRLAVDALIFKGTTINPRVAPSPFQMFIADALPCLAQHLGRAAFAHADDALSGIRVAVADDDVRMRVIVINALLLMDTGNPRGAAFSDGFGKVPHQRGALILTEFQRQRDHDGVAHTGIDAVAVFLAVHPCPRGMGLSRHTVAENHATGVFAGDVADASTCGSGRMGRAPDRFVVEAENCHGPDRPPFLWRAARARRGHAGLPEQTHKCDLHLFSSTFVVPWLISKPYCLVNAKPDPVAGLTMGLWDKFKKGVEGADLQGLKDKALGKVDAAAQDAEAARRDGKEPLVNWNTLRRGLEKIDTAAIKQAAMSAVKATEKFVAKHANRFVERRQDMREYAQRPTSDTFGSAVLATSHELEAMGLGVKVPKYGEKIYDTTGLLLGLYNRGFITSKGDAHHLVVAASGAGKFQAGVGMWLSNGLPGPVMIIDPKGEAAKMFAGDTSASMVLDPWNETGLGSRSLNLIDQLRADNPNLVDDARALSEALILPSGGDTHWDTTARNLASSLLIYIALDPIEDGNRHLMRLREIITLPWQGVEAEESLSNLLTYLQGSELAGGTVKRAANAMLGRADKERQSILSTMERDTAWLESPQIQAVTRTSDVDLTWFATACGEESGAVLFVVIPPRYLTTHRSWLRLVIAATANAFKLHRINDPDPWRRRRHIIIDEFAALGAMSFVENDIAVARGYDIQYHLLVQNFTQLQDAYKANWETFVANSIVQAYGVQDVFTCEYISKLIGVTTRTSLTFSSGSSSSSAMNGGSSSSSSSGSSQSVVARSLVTPDEVRTLSRGLQYIFVRGANPVLARLMFLHEWRGHDWRGQR